MTDPFQNVDAAGEAFVSVFAEAMDGRQDEPVMEQIVATYLGALDFGDDTVTVENGCGAGAVTRRIAAAAGSGRVRAFDISERFIAEARARAGHLPNVEFTVTDGTLPVEDASADHVILHTLLTHVPDPVPLIADAARVLRPGGRLVICDIDFSKGTLASAPNDPLEAMAGAFVDTYVTDPHITGKLRPMVLSCGLTVTDFSLVARPITNGDGMLSWVKMTGADMVARGEIGAPLADALVAEYERRRDAGTLYGFQAVATLIAVKPA